MKKIFLLFVAVCAIAACDPTHEKISNGGSITLEELLAKTTVTTDKAPNGKNGNVIMCKTSAPVNAIWEIGGKKFTSTVAQKKMRKGEHSVKLTALGADGTVLETEFSGIQCEESTDPLVRYYIYGEDPEKEPPFSVPIPGGDWQDMRFDGSGIHLPELSDDVYWGFKTLIFDISDASDDVKVHFMSGWWDQFSVDDQQWKTGQNEFTLTEEIAKICASGNGGQGHQLNPWCQQGHFTLNSVYYEE